MQKVELEDRNIYRAAKGKKVKFANEKHEYREIAVSKTDKREIVEVDA